ncbi:shikimate dehydrogenase [Legionella israelensis]|uniref:shikimate dehydrogenase n=1 Tax=Legionella israelensis TaxID=454 RepID=UPI00117EB88A|nr:shikimate dehydrogenase [Legionella israelensis]QDP71245.1 shikimate dehydrogenase [Legionella israelensis]
MSYRFAVIGHPVAHSLSPVIHQDFANQAGICLQYDKLLGDKHAFEKQVNDFFARGGRGLNVTLPFKERAYAMASMATKRCLAAKAANTLWMESGKLQADNTDGIGLTRDLQRYLTLNGRNILILGAGGAARGILSPLLDFSPDRLLVANRTLSKAEALKKDFPSIEVCSFEHLDFSSEIVINATSSSLSGGGVPFSSRFFAHRPFCYDLAYSSSGVTSFVAYVRALGCQAVDGLGMLVEQAAEAFKIWHGVMPDTLSVLKELRIKQKD